MSHVNVSLRVRPTQGAHGDYITVVPPGQLLINKPGDDTDLSMFNFTYAASDVSNHEVYEQTGKPVVEGVLEGFNGTVLAYGQTGSGACSA